MTDPSFGGDAAMPLADMFDLAPVSLWLEDFSAVRALFEQWRAEGIVDLRAFLRAHPERVADCSARIRVLKVNRRTLELFGADSQEQLVANLSQVFRDDMFETLVEELGQMWDGRTRVSNQSVNYSLQGRRVEILLNSRVLPGHETSWAFVLVSIEDITERMRAQRALNASERYARGLFENSPVSLWVADFSAVRQRMAELRASGVDDLRHVLEAEPAFIERCMQDIRVLDVNRQTLVLFGALDRQTLLKNLPRVFVQDTRPHFAEKLIDLWNGKLVQQRELAPHTLAGEPINVYMQFAVLPGHEHDWSLALISLTDITARKKAEAYLEFLGKHDSLTRLRNRAFFGDEMNRLERRGPWPVSVVVLDLNGLKEINDQQGHAAGDALLRRAGEVLGQLVERGVCAARIGGDEFALLLSGTDEPQAQALVQRLLALVERSNQGPAGVGLSFSHGVATVRSGERLEAALHLADSRMYENKRAHYKANGPDRRRDRGELLADPGETAT